MVMRKQLILAKSLSALISEKEEKRKKLEDSFFILQDQIDTKDLLARQHRVQMRYSDTVRIIRGKRGV
jgi:hypothetical protein